MFKINLRLAGGQTEVPITMDLIAQAEDAGMSVAQYMEHKYPTPAGELTAFQQALVGTGLVMSDKSGRRLTPTLGQIFSGETSLSSTIVRPEGSDRFTPAGRFFFAPFLLEMIQSELPSNTATFESAFMEMVAFTRTIDSPRYDQVVINLQGPRDARSQPISQLAEPVRMLGITTSQVSRQLPTWAIGMEISKEAIQAASLDQVAIAIREHSAAERHRRMISDFMAVVNGDMDAGEAGLMSGAITAQSLDPAILANGTLTQKAWVKYLMEDWEKRTITHLVMNVDTYLAVEGRNGRPVKSDEPAVDERLNTLPRINLPLIPGGVRVLPIKDFPSNLIVGLDSTKALRRIVNSAASYSAVEQFVMRKSEALRIDHSERIESNGYPDAFSVMTLTVPPVPPS